MKIVDVENREIHCADDLCEALASWLDRPTPYIYLSADEKFNIHAIRRDSKYDVYISEVGADLYMRHEMTGLELIERISSSAKFHNSVEIDVFWYFTMSTLAL